jgi:hypothetical protein
MPPEGACVPWGFCDGTSSRSGEANGWRRDGGNGTAARRSTRDVLAQSQADELYSAGVRKPEAQENAPVQRARLEEAAQCCKCTHSRRLRNPNAYALVLRRQ